MKKRLVTAIILLISAVLIFSSCTIVVPNGDASGGNNTGGNTGNGGTDDDGNGGTQGGGTTDGGNDQTPPDGGTTDGGNDQTPPDGGTTDGGNNQTPPDGGTTDGGNNQTPPDGGTTGGGNEDDDKKIIFDRDSELYIIADKFTTAKDTIFDLIGMIDEHKTPQSLSKIGSESSEPNKHEIIFGNTSRDLSKTAMRLLERMEKFSESDVRYLIYSDGSSVAVVYDEDAERIAVESAFDYLLELFDTDELILSSGVVKKESVDVYEYYEISDTEYQDEIFQRLADKVGGLTGENLAGAMRSFYSLYDSEVVVWLANLYEPSICVCNGLYGEIECSGENPICGTGAFYYSNSARDNIGYLPDIESTFQVLGFLNSSGVTRTNGSSWKNMLSEEMLADILAFVRNIQREDGYFIHPQWQAPSTSRISRDLNWATSILNTLGEKPYYDTPLGLKGIGAPAAVSSVTCKLSRSSAIACSKVVAANAESYLPQHKDLATFEKYLNTEMIKIKNGGYDAYQVGNTLTAQNPQIKARDKALGLSGEGSLYNALIKFLNANQNPENGTWDKKLPGDDGYNIYMQVNGLMKISGIYGTEYRMNYVDKACETAMAAITYDKALNESVDIYNPWYALTNIFNNLASFGETDKLNKLRQSLYENAPSILSATRNKIAVFKKASDGSFSYTPKYSSATSQGCPAAVPNSVEGDVNGTLISCAGLLDYIYTALGLSGETKVPLFGDSERLMFMNTISSIRHMDKPNTNMTVDTEDFEYYDVNESPETDALFGSSVKSTDGVIKVVKRADGIGQALMMQSTASGFDNVYIKNQIHNPAATTVIFEGDFCIESSSEAVAVQVVVGSVYMFSFKNDGENIRIIESSSSTKANSIDNDLGAELALGEWFRVKVEYYYGNHDSVRIKFYLDSDLTDDNEAQLIAVSDNYYDNSGAKIKDPKGTPSGTYTETNICIVNNADAKLYIDNTASYKTMDIFTPAADPEGSLKINADAVGEEKLYSFDGVTLPSEFSVSADKNSVEIADVPSMTGFVVPVNMVKQNGRCFAVSADILCSGAQAGKTVMTIVGKEEMGDVVGFALVGTENGSLAVHEYNGSVGLAVVGAEIPLGEKTELRIEHYSDYHVSIIYINGEFIGASTMIYEGGNRRRPTEAHFTFNGGMSYTVELSTIACQRDGKSYVDAVKPKEESIIKDFEGEAAGAELVKNSVVESYGGSKMVKLDTAEALVKIPLHKRSKITAAIDVELDILYKTAKDNGAAHKITVTDTSGNVIFGIVLVINDGNVELYEMSRSGEPRMLVARFAISSVNNNIGFEVFAEKRAAYIYTDGSCVALTESFPYPEYIENEAAYLNIEGADIDSVLYIDNVKAETLYMVFESKNVNAIENKDKDQVLTFEKGNTSSLPPRLHYSLVGSTSSIRISTILNEVAKEYSNAVVMNTKVGANDKIGIKPIDNESLSEYSCVVFETDFKMDLTAGGTEKYWLYFSSNAEATADVAYQVAIEVRNGKLCFHDRSNPNNVSGLLREYYTSQKDAKEWHRLKIEYFNGNKDTARIRLSLDGEVVYVSSIYSGKTNEPSSPSTKTNIKRVYFYSFTNTEGDLYLDNMSLVGTNDTYTE